MNDKLTDSLSICKKMINNAKKNYKIAKFSIIHKFYYRVNFNRIVQLIDTDRIKYSECNLHLIPFLENSAVFLNQGACCDVYDYLNHAKYIPISEECFNKLHDLYEKALDARSSIIEYAICKRYGNNEKSKIICISPPSIAKVDVEIDTLDEIENGKPCKTIYTFDIYSYALSKKHYRLSKSKKMVTETSSLSLICGRGKFVETTKREYKKDKCDYQRFVIPVDEYNATKELIEKYNNTLDQITQVFASIIKNNTRKQIFI